MKLWSSVTAVKDANEEWNKAVLLSASIELRSAPILESVNEKRVEDLAMLS